MIAQLRRDSLRPVSSTGDWLAVEMDWAKRVRALRQRLNLKQSAMAQLVGVSQTYISRLEAGIVAPTDALVAAMDRLTRDPLTRSPYDDIVALVELSPFPCFLVRCEPVDERYAIEAVSQPMRTTYLGDTGALAGDGLTGLRDHVDAICNAGLRDGHVAAARAPWDPPSPAVRCEIHYVPVRDGAGGCCLHGCIADTVTVDGIEIIPPETEIQSAD